MLSLNNETFNDLINSESTVLVDFWAEWCGPCKKMLPVLQDVAEEGLVTVAKVNVDENPDLSQQYEISSIPTMLLFKNGQVVHQIIGAMPKHMLVKEIQEWI